MNYDPVHDTAPSEDQPKSSSSNHSVSISSLLTSDEPYETIVKPRHMQYEKREEDRQGVQETYDQERERERENTAFDNGEDEVDGKGSNDNTDEVTKDGDYERTSSTQSSSEGLKKILTTAQKNKSLTLLLKSRSRHLKKRDGEPMWRKDIQYEFLKELFNNDAKVFSNPFKQPGPMPNPNDENRIPNLNDDTLTFADLYMRTFAESPKCSKILRERLLTDKSMARAVGMVCLLVNVGRMNTTVNFVPEMRSQLRTYHSIPALQVNSNTNTKTLQDTPRLKSILKAVCEDEGQPRSYKDLFKKKTESESTANIINLISLMSSFENNIKYLTISTNNENNEESSTTETVGDGTSSQQESTSQKEKDDSDTHGDFFDFFINSKIVPKCRAQRFLWLMYTYLETEYDEDKIKSNPFGETEYDEDKIKSNPFGDGTSHIPPIELVPDGTEYDVDTEEEKKYGLDMVELRKNYLIDEEHNNTPKRGRHPVPKKHELEDKDFIPTQTTTKKQKKSSAPSRLSSETPIVAVEKNSKVFNKLMGEIYKRKESRFQYKKHSDGLLKIKYNNMKLEADEDTKKTVKYNKVNEYNRYQYELIKKSNDRFFKRDISNDAISLDLKDGNIVINL